MEKITIYTNTSCPACAKYKEKLNELNIKFTEKINSEYQEEWKDIVYLTGMPTVPTVLYKDNYFVANRDFRNAEGLVELLNNFKESSFSNEKQIKERLKTLNYGIGEAFMRLESTLKRIETNYRELFEDEETKTE